MKECVLLVNPAHVFSDLLICTVVYSVYSVFFFFFSVPMYLVMRIKIYIEGMRSNKNINIFYCQSRALKGQYEHYKQYEEKEQ